MKNILGLPLYHVSNVGMDLIPDLQDSIEKLQTEKQHWDRQKSKLSIYTEEGEHKFKLKIDPMEGVKGWEELRKRIKDHVMNYYYFTQPIDDDFQEGPDSKLRDSLKNFWHNYAWYTYFDETDSILKTNFYACIYCWWCKFNYRTSKPCNFWVSI